MWFLECLHILCPRFSFEVVEDDQLPKNEYAHTDVVNHVIRIKESVYDGAYVGNGRDRMTIAHEIGHYVLMCVRGFGLQRNLSKTPARTYEDPEWQAMCFAAELLVPAHLVRGMGASEIARKCGVSREAAEYQLRKLGR
jgi:Zn-dependent peptidase ImmA (M78 family)